MTRPNFTDLSGQRFGRLAVIGRAASANTPNGGARWSVRCDCGTSKDVAANNLVAGRTKSCGCLRRDLRKQAGARP